MLAGWRRRLALRPWPGWPARGSPLTPWLSMRSHGQRDRVCHALRERHPDGQVTGDWQPCPRLQRSPPASKPVLFITARPSRTVRQSSSSQAERSLFEQTPHRAPLGEQLRRHSQTLNHAEPVQVTSPARPSRPPQAPGSLGWRCGPATRSPTPTAMSARWPRWPATRPSSRRSPTRSPPRSSPTWMSKA